MIIRLTLLLLVAFSTPQTPRGTPIHTGAAQHRYIDQVTRVRIKRGELPPSAARVALRVSSPYGTIGTRWRICSKQRTACYIGLQVDASKRKDVPYQQRTGAGLEVAPKWYKPLGCHPKEPPRACRVTIERIR